MQEKTVMSFCGMQMLVARLINDHPQLLIETAEKAKIASKKVTEDSKVIDEQMRQRVTI